MADKNAVMRGLIGGILYDLMVKSNVYNIYVDEKTTLADKLNEIVRALNSKVKTSDIVNDLVTGGAEVPLSAEMGAKLKELIDEATFDETDPTVPDWAKQPEKPDYTAEEIRMTDGSGVFLSDKIREIIEALADYALKSDIPEAVDDALEQAKASGEFDGAPGSSVYYYPDRLNEIIGSISLIPPEQINSYGREIRHGDLIISASGHLYKVMPNNGDDVRVVAQCLTKLQNGNLGYVEPVEVMHQIVVEDAENFNSSNPIPIGTLGLIVGQEYVVKWNGVSYTCIAVLKEYDDGSCNVTIGNVAALNDPSLNTAEPFVIGDVSGDLDGYIYPLESRTRFIISIYRNVYHKIDNRYLDLDWLPAANETTILEEQAVADGRLAAVDSKYLVDGSPVVVYINGIPHKSKIEYIKNDGWYVIAEVKDTVNIYGRVAFLLGRDNTVVLSEFMGGQSVKICLAEYDTVPAEYLPDGYGSGGNPIIDVTELPTENINETAFYRILQGNLVVNRHVEVRYTVHCVDTLPEIGEPATNADNTQGNVYYSVSDGEAYGYVDSILSAGLGEPVGWYPAATLFEAVGYEYAGTISDILDDPVDEKYRLLLEYVLYSYKDGKWWTSHKKTVGGSSKIVWVVVTRDQYGNVEADKTYDQILEESEGNTNGIIQCAFKDRNNPVRVLPLFSLDDERLYFVQNLVAESVSIIHAVTIRPGNVSADVVFYPLVKTVNGQGPDDYGNVDITGGNVGLGVKGAEVGQIVKISAVDQNGVPTAWEAVEFPEEEEFELIKSVEITEVSTFSLDALNLKRIMVYFTVPAETTFEDGAFRYFNTLVYRGTTRRIIYTPIADTAEIRRGFIEAEVVGKQVKTITTSSVASGSHLPLQSVPDGANYSVDSDADVFTRLVINSAIPKGTKIDVYGVRA